MKSLLVIAGPTAVGKTGAALAVAERLGTGILSADSRQVYREMTIGTAKPTPPELARVPHAFVNAASIHNAPQTAADFERAGLAFLEETFQQSDAAVCCGGTGLYIRALVRGLDPMPDVPGAVAAAVEEEYAARGIAWLQEAVRSADPQFFQNSEWQNPARLQRALAFVRATGRSLLSFHSGTAQARSFRSVLVVLDLPRPQLYARINARVDAMMDSGLEDEARELFSFRHLKPLQTVGYAELFDYFDGKCTRAQAVEKIKQHTRNYAKRQLTWFRREAGAVWLRADEVSLHDHILTLAHRG